MGAAKKLEMFPDEAYLAEALRDGRAIRTEISMKALGKPDTRLQAREKHLDLGHVHMLHEILNREGQLAPTVVFKDKAGKLWMADGFHRHEAYRRAGLRMIPAYQVEGEYRDAIEYATMCNRRLCLARRPEDIRKAIEILLADEVWFLRADGWIADHVGCSQGPVSRTRHRFCEQRSIALPSELKGRDGKGKPIRFVRPKIHRIITSSGTPSYKVTVGTVDVGFYSSLDDAERTLNATAPKIGKPSVRSTKDGGHFVNFGNKRTYLGTDRESAQVKFDQLWAEHLKTLEQQPPPVAPPTLAIAASPDPASVLADRIRSLSVADRKLVGDVIGEDILVPFLESLKA